MAGMEKITVTAGSASWDAEGKRHVARRGDAVEVPREVAARWIAQGLARRVAAPEAASKPKAGAKRKSKGGASK